MKRSLLVFVSGIFDIRQREDSTQEREKAGKLSCEAGKVRNIFAPQAKVPLASELF